MSHEARPQYAVVPLHVVRHAEGYEDPAAAAVAASQLVSKDRVARVVVKVMSEVSVSATPHVRMVQIAEVGQRG